jgi:hypothetical protein
MRKNAHTGTVTIETSGGEIRLCFTWEAIGTLAGEYGKDWESEVSRILGDTDTAGIANILSIASDREAAFWLEESPAIIPTAEAIQEALRLAFFGAGALDENPRLARQLVTQLRNLFKSGSNSAGAHQTSGV